VKESTVLSIAMAVCIVAAVVMAHVLAFNSHRYTCAEILGAHPTPGQVAIWPPKWFVEISGEFGSDKRTMRVYDEKHRLVCDASGKDVRR